MTLKKTKIIENPELLINAGNPKGKLGEELINDMNVNHENLAQWGVSHLNISKESVILDIGCGGGVNVKRFLEMTDNNVYGIDYSLLSVKKSSELNIDEILSQRCEIRQNLFRKCLLMTILLILSLLLRLFISGLIFQMT